MAAAATAYQDQARCRCGHSAGAHDRHAPRCALCASCAGFAPRLGERLRAAWAALRDAR